jgi:hypothetical protein
MNQVITMISNSENYHAYNRITDWDICVSCDTSRVKELCRNCGDGVCNGKTCCHIFPHVNGTNYTVCKSCTMTIEKKLVVIINHDELRLLKKKIHSRIKRTIRKIESGE